MFRNMFRLYTYFQLLAYLIPQRGERGQPHDNALEFAEGTGGLLGALSLGLIVFYLSTLLDENERDETVKRILYAANIAEALELVVALIKTVLARNRQRAINLANTLSAGIATGTVVAGTVVFNLEGVPHTRIPAILFFSGMVQRVATMLGSLIYAQDSIMRLNREADAEADPEVQQAKRKEADELEAKYIGKRCHLTGKLINCNKLVEHVLGIGIKSLAPCIVLPVLILGLANTSGLGIGLAITIGLFCLVMKMAPAAAALAGNFWPRPELEEPPQPVPEIEAPQTTPPPQENTANLQANSLFAPQPIHIAIEGTSEQVDADIIGEEQVRMPSASLTHTSQ